MRKSVIELSKVDLNYDVYSTTLRTIKDYVLFNFRNKTSKSTVHALMDISFTVSEGDVFVILGKNGAGKSSILRLIAQLLSPSNGRIITRGQVIPLMQLGVGFEPELTGRENIMLLSLLLGRKKSEVLPSIQKIIEWAEISEAADRPLRTYSSGMIARLAFAVSTAHDSNILLIDETIAVGDVNFQKKCIARIEELVLKGTAVCLVTHDPALALQIANRGMVLERGKCLHQGPIADVVNVYLNA